MEGCGAKERMVLLSTKSKLEHYECEGQLSIFDYQEPIYPLDIKGICDDPYCPKCGRGFWTESKRSEVDCERCPDCGIRLDWTLWHRINDKEDN